MVLTTQCTEDYFVRASPLFDSVKQFWHDRFILGCIGFTPDNYIGEWFHVKHEDIPSYRTDYPKNRPGFVTMQAGDFAEYIDCKDEEPVICIDADCVMQRAMTHDEVDLIYAALSQHVLLSVYHNSPPQTLGAALKNISDKEVELRGNEFTTSFLVARKRTFTRLAAKYNTVFDFLPMITGHHAGNQWLFSFICRDENVMMLSPKYQFASWYSGLNAYMEDGLLKVNGETVIFNHTKFNDA